MADYEVETFTVGAYEVQTYLVYCTSTHRAVIIDPAGEAERIAARVEELGLVVDYILCTHGHPDHVEAAQRMKDLVGAPLAMHQDDEEFFAGPVGREVAIKDLGMTPPAPADILLEHKQKLQVGELTIKVIHTPGHTPGSVCYLVGKDLFTGDTLFVGDVGRTDLAGASLEELLASIEKRLLPLPDKTVIRPGHNYGDTPTSTLAREKAENPYITDFILDK